MLLLKFVSYYEIKKVFYFIKENKSLGLDDMVVDFSELFEKLYEEKLFKLLWNFLIFGKFLNKLM